MSDSTGALDPRGYAIVDQAWFDWMRDPRTVPTLLCPNHPDNSYPSNSLACLLISFQDMAGGWALAG